MYNNEMLPYSLAYLMFALSFTYNVWLILKTISY
jgi:hypothetical protein